MNKFYSILSFSFIFLVFTLSFSSASIFGYDVDIGATTVTTLNVTGLNDLDDTNVPTPTDSYVLTFNSTSGKWEDRSAAAVGDTNETTRFDTLTGTDCGGTDKIVGIQNDGTVLCDTDQTGAGDIEGVIAGDGMIGGGTSGTVTLNVSGDTCGASQVSKFNGTHFGCVTDETGAAAGQNTSGVYLYNDSDTHYFNTTLADSNLSVNSSDNWDNLDTFNSTQFENDGGLLHFLDSWLITFINNWLSGKTTDDLTQGSTNFYDNQSFNQTLTDTLYADINIADTNETARFDNLTAVNCGGTDKVVGVFPNGTVECDADQTGAVAYDLNISGDSGSGDITDSEIFAIEGSGEVSTSMSGNTLTITGTAHTTDTNETARFDNLTAVDCGVGFVVQGVEVNGTVTCVADATGAAGNPFDQVLNTTSNVTFDNVSVGSGVIWTALGDIFAMSHINHSNATNFAFGQEADGHTHLNAPSGQSIGFHINNGAETMELFETLLQLNANANISNDLNVSGLIYGNGSQLTDITTTELDPYWSANFTDQVANPCTPDFVTGIFDNGTFICGTASASDATWVSNWSAYNTTWSTDTNTFNTSQEMWDAVVNGSVVLDSVLNNGSFLNVAETDPFWSANFTNNVVDCPAGNYTYGMFDNGTRKCRNDITGGAAGNPFDQSLNTTDNVSFNNVTVTENVSALNFLGELAWSYLNSYPTACSASQYISVFGDTLTCAAISITISQITDIANANVNSSNYWDDLDSPSDITGLTESQISDLSHTLVNNITCTGNDKVSAYDNVTGTFVCTTDQTGAGDYDLNISADSGSDAITDSEILTVSGAGTVSTDQTGNTLTVTGTAHTTDTNETARFENLTAVNCGGTDKVVGVFPNGTVECDADQTGAGGNPFDQSLNTTDDVTFNNLTVTNNISTLDLIVNGFFRTVANDFVWDMYDNGAGNLHLNVSSVTGINYFGIETAGAFLQLYANPGPANDDLMFTISETQGADTDINFYEGGPGNNRFWSSGSVRIGGLASSLCSNLTTDVDCITAGDGSGADLTVADDGWFGGKLFSSDWSNVSINGAQVIDDGTYRTLSNNTFTTNINLTDSANITIGDTGGRYCLNWDCSSNIYNNGTHSIWN